MANYQAVYNYSIGGRVAANVLDIAQVDSGTDAALGDIDGIANVLRSYWSTNIMQALTSNVVLTSVRVSTFDGTGVAENVANKAGENSNSPMPPNVSYLIRKTFQGRSRGGRIYLPGVPEVGADGFGAVASGTVADFNTQFASMKAGVLADAGVVFGLAEGEIPNQNFFEVTSFQCDSRVATQRRRLRG